MLGGLAGSSILPLPTILFLKGEYNMFRIQKEQISDNIRTCSDNDGDVSIKEEEEFGTSCCNDSECELPDWED